MKNSALQLWCVLFEVCMWDFVASPYVLCVCAIATILFHEPRVCVHECVCLCVCVHECVCLCVHECVRA